MRQIETIHFSRIVPEMRDAVNRIRVRYGHTLSAWHAFHSLYLWQDQLGLSIYLTDDMYAVKFESLGRSCYMMPCGAPDRILEFLETLQQKGKFRLCFLRREDVLFLLEKFPYPLSFPYDRNNTEYLFDIESACGMKGKAYRNIRHKLLRIQSQHEVYAEPLTRSNLPAAINIVRIWHDGKQSVSQQKSDDADVAVFFLRHMEELSASGSLIYMDGEPVSVAAGIPISDTVFDFCVHKQISASKGLGTLSYLMLMEQFRGKYTLLNAEEDMGIPGLRVNKQEMHPCRLLDMWEAVYEPIES